MSTYIDLDSVWRDRQTYPNSCDYQLTPKQVETWVKAVREVRALPQNANERPLDYASSIHLVNVVLPYPRIELFAPKLIIVDSIVGGVLDTVIPHLLTSGDIVMTSSPGYASSSGIQRNVEYHAIVLSATTLSLELSPGSGALALINGTGLGLEMAVIDDPAVPGSNYVSVTTKWSSALQLLNFPKIYLDFHSHRYNDPRMFKTINGVLADAKFMLTVDRTQFDDTLTPKWIHYKSSGEQVMRFKRDDPMIVRFMTRDGTTIPFFMEDDLGVATNPDLQTMMTIMVTPYLRDAVYANHMVEPIM
jgi:hypothetical protein